MFDSLGPVVFAAQGIPPGSAAATLMPLIGAIIFLGSIYMLLRSNLGTRRGYLVFGTATFGFMVIMSLFWTFGAPGTPQATGPTNLPGQVPNEYQPTWTAFHETSRIAELDTYRFVTGDPGRFGPVPDGFVDEAENGASEIQNFFATEEHGERVGPTWAIEDMRYAPADNGLPVLAVTYREVDEALEPVPDGETVTLYGFFDAGNPIFPGLVFTALSLILFLLHAFLLDRDELRERRELTEGTEEVREPVAV